MLTRSSTGVARDLKAYLKAKLPAAFVDRWQRFRFAREQAHARGRPLGDVFEEIYEKDLWANAADGARYSSGPGSLPDATRDYEDFVVDYLCRHPDIQRLVDIGCGDFQVASRILEKLGRPVRYVGCDIAANVVAYNRARHGRDGVEFLNLDVTRDPLPPGDIVMIREVFQHLSNDAITAALANLKRSFAYAIVTEAQPLQPVSPNLDIVSGYRTRDGLNSGVFLELAPFNLTIVDQMSVEASPSEVLRTTLVRL